MKKAVNVNKSISLPPELIEKIDRLAAEQSRSFNNMVKLLLEEGMKKHHA